MRFFYLLAIVAGLLCSIVPAKAAAPLQRLGTSGNHIVTADGKPVTLRGVSLCSLEWGNQVALIDRVMGFDPWAVNVLRLPVQIQEWNRVGKASYLRDYLDPAVAACTRNNVYCIIDWHAIAPWNTDKQSKTLSDFWDTVAPRYASNPRIIYELFNEPVDPSAMDRNNWLTWRGTAQGWVDRIRQHAPQTLILIGSPHWTQMTGYAAADPFHGDNLAYTMHLYPNWGHNMWDSLFGKAADSVPVVITEWGWSAAEKNKKTVFTGSRESFGEPLRQYLKDKPQIGWTAWSYDPQCGPAMLGQDADMGAFVKEWLDDEKAGAP